MSFTRGDQRRRWPTLDHALATLPVVVLPDLEFLADAIGAAVLGHLPLADDANALWNERDQITQATGMVVAQLDLDPDDALAVLRAHAFAQDVTLLEVSRSVLARDLGFGSGRAR